MSTAEAHRAPIEAAFADRTLLREAAYERAVVETVDALDRGELRVAEPAPGGAPGEWITHASSRGRKKRGERVDEVILHRRSCILPPFRFTLSIRVKLTPGCSAVNPPYRRPALPPASARAPPDPAAWPGAGRSRPPPPAAGPRAARSRSGPRGRRPLSASSARKARATS